LAHLHDTALRVDSSWSPEVGRALDLGSEVGLELAGHGVPGVLAS